MGVKAIENKYRVVHIVQLREFSVSHDKYELCLCIGSAYIPECIVVSLEGKIIKGAPDRSNADLNRYYIEMKQDEGETLKGLIHEKDVYAEVIPVYTFDNGRVIKKFGEPSRIGFPNTFTDGEIMYNNVIFNDIESARAACRKDARAGVKMAFRRFKEVWSECAGKVVHISKHLFRETYYYLYSFTQ